jgi:topoisomerase-4 subunit A
MTGIDEDSVDMVPNFDGTTTEPAVMPGAFPNLLANGAMGIAVGMATNIPTHNVAEVMDALALVIDRPAATTAQIMKKLIGPDFPTGGVIIDDFDTIVRNYESGRGTFRVRAKWSVERLERGAYQIVITEIPYGIVKQKLVEQIAGQIDAKKLPLVEDIADESTTDVRIVITPKSRGVEPEKVMAHLFAMTDLQANFSMNFNVVDSAGVPRVMKIGDVLGEFLAHQRAVLRRRTNWRLGNIAKRLEILGGLLIVYLNLDRVIEIIRNEDDPKSILAAEFSLTEMQVEAILNTRLRSLRKLEEMEIKKEDKDLRAEQKKLKSLLASDEMQNAQIKEWFAEIKKQFAKNTPLGRRKSEWLAGGADEEEINVEDFVEKEPRTVVLSKMGWIRAAAGHLDLGALDAKFREGDELMTAFHCQSTDKVNLFASNGKMYSLAAGDLPSARGFGESVRLMADIGADDAIIAAFALRADAKYLVMSRHGIGFVVSGENCLAQTKNGKQIMTVDEKNPAAVCVEANGKYAAIVGSNDKLLILDASEIPEMARGKGVVLQKYNADKTYVMDAMFFDKDFGWTTGRGATVLDDWKPWRGRRAGQGQTVPVGFPRSGKFGK